MMPTIIICHENPIMLAGLTALAQSVEDCNVIQCDTAEASLQCYKSTQIELLVCSFTIPMMGAIQITKRLHAIHPESKILICGEDDSGYIAEKCIQNGAHGYITSQIAVAEFLHAINAIRRGVTYTESNVAQKLALRKIRGSNHVFDVLSPREFDIFSKVICDKTSKEVAEELFLAEKTVANYISIIKKKLHTKTSAGLLRVGINEGFIPLKSTSNLQETSQISQ